MLIRVMTSFSNFLFMRPFGSRSLLLIEGQVLINLGGYLTGMSSKGKHRLGLPFLSRDFLP